MTSLKQLEANRKNAKLSTGPATPAGKQVAALNSRKHGLLSKEVLVKGEQERDLVEIMNDIRSQLAPEGGLEEFLVDRIATSAWRLKRLIRIETEYFERKASDFLSCISQAFLGDGATGMNTLTRYEATLERSILKALHELQRLQAMRRGQAVTPPLSVDIDIHT